MTDKILYMAAEFERRAETPTNLMTSNEFMFVAAALRELVALRDERKPRYVWQPHHGEELGLEAAIRAAKLALFVIRKQGVMPNSSWESGFDADMKTAEETLAALRVRGAAQAEPEPTSRYVGPRMYQQEKYGK